MKIVLDIKKNTNENASIYFEKAKKAKKKIEGAKKALEKSRQKLKKALSKKEDFELKEKEKKSAREKKWFEKFRWFYTSEGFFVLGGRDATTNEILIKKHTDKDDIVFHTKMEGSPFFVIKTDGKKPGKKSLEEVANATITFSRAFKLGIESAEVFYVSPEQLSKTPKAGEYIVKGSFIVTGKMNIMHAKIDVFLGTTKEGMIMAGPMSAIKKNCEKHVKVLLGKEKAGAIAKIIKNKLGGELDEIIRVLPSGTYDIKV